MVVDSLSNQFKQNITTHKPVIKLSYNAKKLITVLVFWFYLLIYNLTQSKGTIGVLKFFPSASNFSLQV
jgi:hypothetical protein